MIFHFDFGNYFKMLRLAYGESNRRVRLYYLTLLLFWVPPVAALHAVCFFLDGILFPGLWRTEIREPVFVVGHARSGTTLTHRLLSEDTGRFSSFRLYELYFPSLLQKKLIRWLAAIDRRLLGGTIARRVDAWEEKHYAAVRKVHKMGLREYEEDDIVLYYSCASGFWITKMPYMGELDFYYVDERSPRKRRRLMRFYRECVRRQLYLNGGHKIHLSKNPLFAGRVASLIETFPGARIVVPMRNPYETIPSLLSWYLGLAQTAVGQRSRRQVPAHPRQTVFPHLPLSTRSDREASANEERRRRLSSTDERPPGYDRGALPRSRYPNERSSRRAPREAGPAGTPSHFRAFLQLGGIRPRGRRNSHANLRTSSSASSGTTDNHRELTV